MLAAARSEGLTKPKKGKGKPEHKRQGQEPLPQGDLGPEPPALAHRAEVMPLYQRGGGWRIRYVRHPLEIMAKPQGRAGKGLITARQRNGGMDLFKLSQELGRTSTPPWNRPYVDSSARGDVDQKRLDAQTAYRLALAFVPPECQSIVQAVVCGERMVWELTEDKELRAYWLELLRDGLDGLADAFGY